MNDMTAKVDGITLNADELARMLSTPRITEDYWAEADRLELEYINANIEPEAPSRFRLDEDQRLHAIALRRTDDGLQVWWSDDPEPDRLGDGFWTDIDGRLVEDED